MWPTADLRVGPAAPLRVSPGRPCPRSGTGRPLPTLQVPPAATDLLPRRSESIRPVGGGGGGAQVEALAPSPQPGVRVWVPATSPPPPPQPDSPTVTVVTGGHWQPATGHLRLWPDPAGPGCWGHWARTVTVRLRQARTRAGPPGLNLKSRNLGGSCAGGPARPPPRRRRQPLPGRPTRNRFQNMSHRRGVTVTVRHVNGPCDASCSQAAVNLTCWSNWQARLRPGAAAISADTLSNFAITLRKLFPQKKVQWTAVRLVT